MNVSSARGSWFVLAGFITAAFVAGAIGSAATFENVRTWYPTLTKPSWNPPGWIFGPVWTTLYGLMGVAVWRAWRTGPAARPLVRLYFVQLVCNALWSVLFFGLKQPAWALVDILALLGCLLWLQRGFWRTDRLAGALWVPYVLWVSFATVLNATIVRLN
ncbi:TspO/MBR family protein [Lacunisphaera limnophila]|uniref:TspO/MBR family protein n=1 Tax=Lacunisphaera limnophila TaxID=1838286 RepID=A0A1D8ATE9_9BACT|nr:TspO/MBR family protein [Lacunisphaera limnophila]AOS44171.1 TspO/MBR family protein [Lacunisphaera limnophila]